MRNTTPALIPTDKVAAGCCLFGRTITVGGLDPAPSKNENGARLGTPDADIELIQPTGRGTMRQEIGLEEGPRLPPEGQLP